MASARLVLAAVALTATSAAAFAAAAGDFATAALPEAARSLLAQDRPSIAIQGDLNSAQADHDSAVIHASMRRVFGPSAPLRYDSARWSDQLALPGAGKGGVIPLIEAGAMPGVRGQAALLSGAWFAPPRPGRPIPAVVLAAAAAKLRLSVGDVLRLRDSGTGAPVSLRVAGVIRPRDPGAPYWRLNVIDPSGVSGAAGFVTYGPFLVDPAAFAAQRLTVGQASWVVAPDLRTLRAADLKPLAARVSEAAAYLSQSDDLHGLAVDTDIPATLSGIASDLIVARSMLAILTVELLLLAGASLSLAARLLASQRTDETALLAARGASRWQLAGVSGAETALLCVAAVGAGIGLGGPLAGLMARSGPLRPAGLRIPAAPSPASWWIGAAVFAICAGVLLWPTLRPSQGIAASGRHGRQAALAGAVAAGGDIALLTLAVLAGWQLRRYSAVAPTARGGIGVDPVLVIAPALALAGGAVATLRLLPLLAHAAERAAARGARLGAALPGWQISRRPVRQSGAALLATLAAAAATFAIAQHASAARSLQDQAEFRAGADVRLDSAVPVPLSQAHAIAAAPGVISAMPAARAQTTVGLMLGLDARRAAATVLLRSDLASEPGPALWRSITPPEPAPGPAAPARARRLAVTARLDPGPVSMDPAYITLTVQDGAGDTYQIAAGSLPADGRRHMLIAHLPGAAVAPLRLVGISAQYADLTPIDAGTASLAIDAIAASARDSGPLPPPFAVGSSLTGWTATATAFPPTNVFKSQPPAFLGWRATRSGAAEAAFFPGYFQTLGSTPTVLGTLTLAVKPPAQLPAIATRSFLAATHRRVGAIVPVALGTANFTVNVVAAVADFPTVSEPGGALIVDQRSLQDTLAAAGSIPLPVSEWWLAMRPGAAPPAVPDAAVTARARVAAALRADPLSTGPQQGMAALALMAAALAVLGLAVGVAAAVRDRREVSALLAALGVSRGAQARMLCAEQLALSGPAALAGVGIGALLAALLVPAVTLTATARAPVPPVLLEFGWGQIGAMVALVALTPVALAAVTIARRPDPAARLRAAEAV